MRHQVLIGFFVLVDVREVEISHLQHRFDIFRGRCAAESHIAATHREVGIGDFACEGLFQFGQREIAESADADDLVEELQVAVVIRAVERFTARAFARQNNLVFLEIGLLQQHHNAIRQLQFGVAELVVFQFFLDGSSLRQLRDERFVLHVIDVGFNLLCTGVGHGLEQTFAGRIDVAFLLVVKRDDDHIRVVFNGFEHLFRSLVDGLERQHRHDLLHRFVGEIDARHRFVRQEMTQTLRVELRVRALFAVFVGFVERTEVVGLETVVFGRRVAKFGHAASLDEHGFQRIVHLVHFLRRSVETEGVFRLGEDVVSITCRSAHEGASGLLNNLGKTAVEHTHRSAFHVVENQIR